MSSTKIVVLETPLTGLMILQRILMEDHRGFFSRFFCADELREAGFDRPIAQINHTFTRRKGAVRGLHFQYPPHAEIKIVSCLKGEIFDVAVDLRRHSPTFLQWRGEILSADNRRSLLIPAGFAHGFQTLADDCELIYLHSEPHCPEAEGGVHAGDPRLAVQWPLTITELSERDQRHPFLSENFDGVTP